MRKKVKMIRSFISFVLVVVILTVNPSFALAAEGINEVNKDSEVQIDEISAHSNSAGTMDVGVCSSRGKLTLYPTLDSYVGFTRYFWFWAYANESDKTPSGAVHVTVKKPDGTVLDSFSIGADVDYVKKFTLPPSGQYTVEIVSQVNARLRCTTFWTANKVD